MSLNRLCRVCGYLVVKNKYPIGTTKKIKLKRHSMHVFRFKNVYPSKICHKCYDIINIMIKRVKLTALLFNMNRKPHAINAIVVSR